jgi:hypothetical protein
MTSGKKVPLQLFTPPELESQSLLKDEDLARILANFGKIDDHQRGLISWSLQTACHRYSSSAENSTLTLSEHKRKFEQTAASSKKLINLLRSNGLDAAKLVSLPNTPTADPQVIMVEGSDEEYALLLPWKLSSEEAQRNWEVFWKVLESLSDEASAVTQSTKRLTALRGFNSDKTRKSKERRYLWEPVFQLLVDAGCKVGGTPKGPLMRILNVIHAALSVEPPHPDAVRQAFREFKTGGVQQAKKRGSTPLV